MNTMKSAVRFFSSKRRFFFPRAVDWRKNGALTPVRNQGCSGICTIFACVDTIESAHQIRSTSGELIELSRQHMLNRIARQYSRQKGVLGASMDAILDGTRSVDVFKFAITKGIPTEKAFPYKGIQEALDSIKKPLPDFREKYFIDAQGWIAKKTSKETCERMEEQVTKQPIVGYVDASSWPAHGWNEDEVYSGPPSCQQNHAIVIAGYGIHKDQTKFWLIKNSWGTEFGNNGYLKVERGVNAFGIEMMATFPIVYDD